MEQVIEKGSSCSCCKGKCQVVVEVVVVVMIGKEPLDRETNLLGLVGPCLGLEGAAAAAHSLGVTVDTLAGELGKVLAVAVLEELLDGGDALLEALAVDLDVGDVLGLGGLGLGRAGLEDEGNVAGLVASLHADGLAVGETGELAARDVGDVEGLTGEAVTVLALHGEGVGALGELPEEAVGELDHCVRV